MKIKDIYPLTVVKDRYTGVYSGGKFTAWNLEPYEVPLEICDGDGPCMNFWDRKEVLAGCGETPTEAIIDLAHLMEEAERGST